MQSMQTENEHSEINHEDLHNRLNRLPGEIQTTIASFTSYFLEPDVYEQYAKDPLKIESFRTQLVEIGFNPEAIDVTMRLVGFTKNPQEDDNV